MPKHAAYKNIEVFNLSKRLVVACYELTQDLPEDEKTNFSRYIRRAALGVHINIAKRVFAKPEKRKKFIGRALNFLIIIETATEILVEVGFVVQKDVDEVIQLISKCREVIDE